MALFYKFSFWLPLLSFGLITFELFARPAKSLVRTVIDPVFTYFHSLLPETTNALFILLPFHFLLALLYGFAIDALIKKVKESPTNL